MRDFEPEWVKKLPERLREGLGEYPHCTSAYLTDEARQHVKRTQALMLDLAAPVFDGEDQENLRWVVRLTVEFYYYLQTSCTHKHCASYISDSVLWGIEGYQGLAQTYRCLQDAVESTLDWDKLSVRSLKATFLSLFDDFEREILFERKCRLLLDLFKLQIVFSAVFNENGIVSKPSTHVSAIGRIEEPET